MSDVLATLALSVVFGIAATIGFYFVGELSSAQSIFLGFLVTASTNSFKTCVKKTFSGRFGVHANV